MDLLKRHLAPIVPAAWDAIDEEARAILSEHLAGRKLV
ncbi:MAG TPA: encapsulin, partial [Haliangium sp.]|nr:encapsulin [Haliangium sp.]